MKLMRRVDMKIRSIDFDRPMLLAGVRHDRFDTEMQLFKRLGIQIDAGDRFVTITKNASGTPEVVFIVPYTRVTCMVPETNVVAHAAGAKPMAPSTAPAPDKKKLTAKA